jgi:diguanylate cyclase (GGDEF)-like protein
LFYGDKGVMLIDLKTLVLLNSALGLVASIMLTINWSMNQKVKGTREWAVTLWCWSFSMVLLLLRGTWPPLLTVVLSNGLVVIGSLFLLSGLSKYHYRGHIPWWLVLLVSVLMFYGFYYFSEIDVNIRKRILLLTSFSALVKFTALYLLIPTLKRFTAVGIVMAFGFIVHGLFFTYHSYLGAFGPADLANVQLQKTTILLMVEVFLFMLWFTVSATMLTNVVLQTDLKRIAYRDTLTGVLNRRSILEMSELSIEKYENSNFSLLILDLDKFKDINDNFGHAAGDKVLQAFASTVGSELRESDFFGRIGGEEFLISLPQTDLNQAELIADRICKAVNGSTVNCDGKNIEYTVSIGVDSLKTHEKSSLSELIMHADKAMYIAKSTGRNKYMVYQKPD